MQRAEASILEGVIAQIVRGLLGYGRAGGFPDAKPHPVIFVPVAAFDAGMRGGRRALSDG
jgi:hypothetical protein